MDVSPTMMKFNTQCTCLVLYHIYTVDVRIVIVFILILNQSLHLSYDSALQLRKGKVKTNILKNASISSKYISKEVTDVEKVENISFINQ